MGYFSTLKLPTVDQGNFIKLIAGTVTKQLVTVCRTTMWLATDVF